MDNWVAVAALIVAVVGIPLSIWATRRWGNRRAQLEIGVTATPLLPEGADGPLQVTYRDIAVAKPYLVSVTLRNVGPRDISTATFDSGRPITVRFDETFYGLTSTDGGVRAVAPAIGSSGEQAVVRIEPGLLKQQAEWSFSAVTTGPVEVSVDAPLIDTDVQEAVSDEDRREVTVRMGLMGIPIEVDIPIGRRAVAG
ncbi:hypothetical protein ACPESR_25265 [Nocardia testacea]|uniref:hypothetical protein n=1 Tax=Nocardia testacea TaxID=248551 RepID=UPI003C2EB623